jgi:hypothetical protein
MRSGRHPTNGHFRKLWLLPSTCMRLNLSSVRPGRHLPPEFKSRPTNSSQRPIAFFFIFMQDSSDARATLLVQTLEKPSAPENPARLPEARHRAPLERENKTAYLLKPCDDTHLSPSLRAVSRAPAIPALPFADSISAAQTHVPSSRSRDSDFCPRVPKCARQISPPSLTSAHRWLPQRRNPIGICIRCSRYTTRERRLVFH